MLISIKVPTGRSQTNLLLLAHQHILRLQAWWLMKEKNLPADFEELIRALWEQRVNALADKIDDATISTFEMPISDTEDEGNETRNMKLDDIPTIVESLSLCYLGIYILRLPVFIGDIVRWVKNKWLPYIGAVDLLPSDMKSRLAFQSLNNLRDNRIMSTQRLQSKTNALFMAYQLGLGIEIPHLNVPLCLYRITEGLALPLEIYPAVRKLAALLKYTFPYPTRPTKGWMHSTPDKQLAAFVVVAVKLLYPFDALVRDPTKDTEPAAAIIDWDVWRKVMKQRDESLEDQDILTHEKAQRMTENESLQISEAKADQYMDWFTNVWAKPGEARALVSDDMFVQNMFKLFPIGDHTAEVIPMNLEDFKHVTLEGIHEVHRGLIPRAVREPDDSEGVIPKMGRPGTQYLRYRKMDEMDEVAKEFYEAVADFVGCPVNLLTKCTFSIERKLEHWMKGHEYN